MIRNLVIISALFSICWGFTDLTLKLLRTSCDPIIFNTSYTDDNINFCRDTYALIQNCLEETNTNGSYNFQSYGCALEYEFGYSEQVPYKEYSNAYNWVKDHGLCTFAIKKDNVWNFDLFHDYKPNPSKCSTIAPVYTTALVSKIASISTTTVNSKIANVRTTSVPIQSPSIVASILPQPSTTSIIGSPTSINSPSSSTTRTSSRTTTDSYKTPGSVNEENGSSANLNDDTKMVAIVVVVCLAVVIIPTIIIAIRLIKG